QPGRLAQGPDEKHGLAGRRVGFVIPPFLASRPAAGPRISGGPEARRWTGEGQCRRSKRATMYPWRVAENLNCNRKPTRNRLAKNSQYLIARQPSKFATNDCFHTTYLNVGCLAASAVWLKKRKDPGEATPCATACSQCRRTRRSAPSARGTAGICRHSAGPTS